MNYKNNLFICCYKFVFIKVHWARQGWGINSGGYGYSRCKIVCQLGSGFCYDYLL